MKKMTMVVCNCSPPALMSLKPKNILLVVFFYNLDGDIGIVIAVGAILEVVGGVNAIFKTSPKLKVF